MIRPSFSGQQPERSLVVVVPQVLVEDPLKMTTTPDQHPVQTLPPDGSYPPLGERAGVGRLDGRRDDLDAVAGEDVVEGAGELAVAVTNKELRRAGSRCPLCFPAHRELSCSLDDPRPVRMVVTPRSRTRRALGRLSLDPILAAQRTRPSF
jgi:hypothetical protein